MAVLAEESFDAPIPGMSLTHALGDRPWQQPSQFTTVDDAIEYYMARMTSEEFMMQLVDVLEMGVPVTTLANTIQLSNVMEGKHTVDVGMLVTPLLMELIMMLAESAGIKYDSGLNDPAGNKTSSTFFAKYLKKYGDKLQETDIDTLQEESQEPVEEADEEPKGLMARRK
tara:strand:- start:65 stop:574 length:510 start_codon:yes stop_codon:yes gene_type:complete